MADNQSHPAQPEAPGRGRPRRGQPFGDPAFAYLLLIAVALGLVPLIPDQADLRYTIAWLAMIVVGGVAWFSQQRAPLAEPDPRAIGWGAVFGLLLAIPFLLLGGGLLARTASLMFGELGIGTVLAYAVFVIPPAETLFLRGMIQRSFRLPAAIAMATLWHLVLFFPVFWSQILENAAVGLAIALALAVTNAVFTYVSQRDGLLAAWACQTVVWFLIIFLPFAFSA
jgi:hypothetical protein